jgi:hypothetical protein
MTEQRSNLREYLEEWYSSDAFKELQKANEEARQRAIGKYHMLSEEDKIDMIEAVTYIMCKAEKEGCSHRGLQSALGIYPGGFWVDYLMDVHNALWTYYHDKNREKEMNDDLDSLDNFLTDETLKQKKDVLTDLDTSVKLASPNTEVNNDSEQ